MSSAKRSALTDTRRPELQKKDPHSWHRRRRSPGLIKLQIAAGAATPAPPVGPALGQHGVNIIEFTKAYNAATESQRGSIIPVEITVYEDRSFTFVLKTPPAAELIKSCWHPEGFRHPQHRQGWFDHDGSGSRNRPVQDG